MPDVRPPAVQALCAQIAANLQPSPNAKNATLPPVADIAAAVSEITPRTQIAGASLLTIQLADPLLRLTTQYNWLTPNSDGTFQEIDLNFPFGSDSWWRLCMVQPSTQVDTTSPNVTVTFEDRIISYLRDEWGPLVAGARTQTRAQFIVRLVKQVGAAGGQTPNAEPIKIVCPSENVLQPLASSTSSASGTTTFTPSKQLEKQIAKANKNRGAGGGAALTVKGSPITPTQLDNANTGLTEAIALKAPVAAMVALMYAGMGESSLGADADTFSGVSVGVWQAQPPHYGNGRDTAGMAKGFLTGGQDFGNGGAIKLALAGHAPAQIANAVEVNAVYIGSGGNSANPNAPGDSYAHQFPGGQAAGLKEAEAIVAAFGGGSLGTTPSSSVGGSTTSTTSDVATLARGTPDNSDESSWDCIQRLAADVQWFAFSNADTFYYMDGPDLVAQRPAAYIRLVNENGELRWGLIDSDDPPSKIQMDTVASLSGTIDATSFVYRSTHKRKGRIIHASRQAKPQTPTEWSLNLVCDWDQYRAGDVLVVQDAGPFNGRWIISDATRNVLGDTFTQFTLEPSIAPNPEPTSTTTSAASTSTVGGTIAATAAAGGVVANPKITDPGTLAGVAEAARLACQLQAQKHCYHYDADFTPGGHGNYGKGLFDAPFHMDCSGFTVLCYKAAGCPDPNGTNYSVVGSSFTIQDASEKVPQSQALPGDMCIFPNHICVYLGNGQVANMGGPGQPYLTTLQNEIDGHGGAFNGFFRAKGFSNSGQIPGQPAGNSPRGVR